MNPRRERRAFWWSAAIGVCLVAALLLVREIFDIPAWQALTAGFILLAAFVVWTATDRRR